MAYERSRRRSSVALNLTPLIDVVFLLLVFFLLTAHFVQEKQIDVKLPKAESSESFEEEMKIEVVISEDGVIRIDEQIVAVDDLKETLQKRVTSAVNKSVVLRADATTHLELAVKVMDASRLAGAQSVEILTETP
jgi:biopolymer transport protein ExbD